MRRIFPFTAIVGQERMKRALVLNAIDSRIGGVLIRGERGTAKSTAARAMAALLPEIEVFAESPFNDDPNTPETWSDWAKTHTAENDALPVVKRRIRFIDLPVSATEDRVVGTLDIEKAIKQGERHFDPGVLAAANRGLLYIDEVNLLDDHVVDLLLDSAAMGINIVEREGISFSHPARFILVGTMNPEEGDLRPQLLDRFAFSVEIRGLTDADSRVQIMARNLAFEATPDDFYAEWQPSETELSDKIAQARAIVDKVTYSERDMYMIASLTAELQVDGHRPDLVILRAARAHAAFEGRTYIDHSDILRAAELALPHRMKKGPLHEAHISLLDLEEKLGKVASELNAKGETQDQVEQSVIKKKQDLTEAGESEETREFGDPDAAPQQTAAAQDANWWEGGKKVETGRAFRPRTLDTPLDKLTRSQSGRRSRTRTDRKRGRYIQARPANGDYSDIAFDATLRAAAPMQQQRRGSTDMAFAIETHDLQRKVRVRKSSNLILFVVDASWSMAVAERMSATKGAIMSLLTDAYQRRDRVGLVVFQKDRATLVMPPTNSVLLARKALADIPVGGKTPLSAGLALSLSVIQKERISHPDVMPLIVLLTDGAGNVSMTDHLSPQNEAHQIAEQIHQNAIRSVVINMEHAAFDQGLAQELAHHLDAPCMTLHDLQAEMLYQTVKSELLTGVVK